MSNLKSQRHAGAVTFSANFVSAVEKPALKNIVVQVSMVAVGPFVEKLLMSFEVLTV
jgi:hypothetical protein